MNWYLTKMVFQIISGEGDHHPQFDEQLRLISADSEAEAFDKAFCLGKSETDTFINKKNQPVKWLFINVSDVYRINELSDGVELYSRIEEKDHAGSYIQAVNRRAEKYKKERNLAYIE